ncbi:unnamed protein product [Medioppia subpectinata]|uniref:Uncharacterized protein n=1 Tax=Medioppia subpectinata TaxID=1979941 RepID=A0A7R9KQN3_9ACAR|nr:unnamed protein product [Medioppia subpectinata]CAG2107913.1 unnamed protein product [Medioppia subpectinata]
MFILFIKTNRNVFMTARNGRDFTGKVVLVTGSSSGIGESVVKLFSALGANVVVTGRKADRVNRVAQEAQQLSPKKLQPLAIVADVTKSVDLNNLLNETIKTFGKLDVLVNNAGMGLFSPVKDSNFMKVFDTLIKVNLKPYLKLTHLAVPYLEATNGSVISISSVIGMVPLSDFTVGGCVIGFDRGYNTGFVTGNLTRGADPEMTKMLQQEMFKRIPLQKVGQPLDVANAAVFLASKDAQYITGANLVIDGGILYNSGGIL